MNPSRLSLARRKRGLTKKRLAELCGLGTRTITAYEKGEIEASPEYTERLAAQLGFPPAFFDGDDLDEPQAEGSSFRSLSRMTARQRDSALATGALGFHVATWIEERFNLPKPSIPDLESMTDPEKAADRLRTEWGLGWGPISSMIRLLEAKGVFVFSLAGAAREVDAFSTWNGERPFVFLNPDKTAERLRMDCAHELAHLSLHRHQKMKSRDIEQEAKVFAGSFLLPRDGLRPMARRAPSPQSIIRDKVPWKVSAMAYIVRLNRLDLISDWHYRRLCIQFAHNGDKEPNGIAREQSALLGGVLASLREEGVTRRLLAEQLCLSYDDLQALLSGLVLTEIGGDGTGARQGPRPQLRIVK